MKKALKAVAIALAIAVVLAAGDFVIPGFTRLSNVYISDFSLSDDGKEMTITVGVSTSMGYTRDLSVKKGEKGKMYLDFYSAFGGINGSIGAKRTFNITLDDDTEIIYIRNGSEYRTAMVKDEKGNWGQSLIYML